MNNGCVFKLTKKDGEEISGWVRVDERMNQDAIRLSIYAVCEVKRGEVELLEATLK